MVATLDGQDLGVDRGRVHGASVDQADGALVEAGLDYPGEEPGPGAHANQAVLQSNGCDPAAVPSASSQSADGDADGTCALSRRYEMGIGFSLFLFVVGAILTFAVDANTSSGFSIDTIGIILMIGGLLGLLLSALFWSSFSPWSRRRTVAGGDRVVEERRIEREF